MGTTLKSLKSFAECERQYWLPLISQIEVSEAVSTPPKRIKRRQVRYRIEPASTYEWKDDHLVKLHCCLLDETFSVAGTARTTTTLRDEIISWVLELTPKGENLRPFSFGACCALAGYDAAELRDLFITEMTLRGFMKH